MAKKAREFEHILVPKHEKLNKTDKDKLLEKYNVSIAQLPKISKKDPAISHLQVTANDVVKITRKSPTAGESVFYRVVVDE